MIALFIDVNIFCVNALVQHDLIYTFCHPMLRDEQDFDKTNVLKLRG